MAYRLPPAEEVAAAVEAVLAEHGMVGSQASFHRLVAARLKETEADYRLGPARLRKLAVQSRLVRLEIHTRANPRPRPVSRCPVCGSSFKLVRNSTLYGGEVTLGHLCPLCHFSTGRDWREPARYVFHAAGRRTVPAMAGPGKRPSAEGGR